MRAIELPPALADLPQPLYFFDGVCVLCSGFVQFYVAREHDGAMRFATTQSALGRRTLGALGLPADLFDRTVLLVEDGLVHFESDAALRALARLPAPWRWLAVLRRLPAPLRDAAYRLVARNRYRWFGQRPSCFVPDPAQRARFIDP